MRAVVSSMRAVRHGGGAPRARPHVRYGGARGLHARARPAAWMRSAVSRALGRRGGDKCTVRALRRSPERSPEISGEDGLHVRRLACARDVRGVSLVRREDARGGCVVSSMTGLVNDGSRQ